MTSPPEWHGQDRAPRGGTADVARRTRAGRFVEQAAEDGLRRVVSLSTRGVGSPGRTPSRTEWTGPLPGWPSRYVDLDPDDHLAEPIGFGLPRQDAETVRDLFAVIRDHGSEDVSDGVAAVLGQTPRDFPGWARSTAKTGAWSTT
ncbi:hypothetical protein [Amycolatopsis panacis]|uniref:hypothetical protein n=1 Tax=Amycolatopsis panacis TaxID=2340917 RepID=UPI0018F75ED7|nr:hypothetical protein [Amycolatopsis panacis]